MIGTLARAERAARLPAREHRKHQVEHDQLWAMALRQFQPLFARLSREHGIACMFEIGPYQPGHRSVVFDDQYCEGTCAAAIHTPLILALFSEIGASIADARAENVTEAWRARSQICHTSAGRHCYGSR